MNDQDTPQKIKFNPSVLVHTIAKEDKNVKSGPITIADINAEIGDMDNGIEFIQQINEKDHLLDAFISEEANNSNGNSN